jgi:hypothetical protein
MTTLKPPIPPGCRPAPKFVSLTARLDEALEIRRTLRVSADASVRGVLAPGDRRHVPPSFRMYTTNLRGSPRNAQASEAAFDRWRQAWFYALAEEVQHASMAALLTAMDGPLLCRKADPAGACCVGRARGGDGRAG